MNVNFLFFPRNKSFLQSHKSQKMNSESFQSIVVKQTRVLNTAMAGNKKNSVNTILTRFVNETLPTYSNGRIQEGEWILHTDLEIIPYQICLLASYRCPKRCLAILEKSNDCVTAAKGVVDAFCYSILKITTKKKKRGDVEMTISTISPGKLFTTRRGFYIMNKGVLNEKLSAINDQGTLKLRAAELPRIKEIYFKYVHGMDENPDFFLQRVPADMGMEQFLLREYPTKEWKYNVLNKDENHSVSKKYYDDSQVFESSKLSEPVKCCEKISSSEGKGFNFDNVETENFEYVSLTDSQLNYKPIFTDIPETYEDTEGFFFV